MKLLTYVVLLSATAITVALVNINTTLQHLPGTTLSLNDVTITCTIATNESVIDTDKGTTGRINVNPNIYDPSNILSGEIYYYNKK